MDDMPAQKQFGATVNGAVTQEMKDRVFALAAKQGRREADVLRAALSLYLNKEEKRAR
jgi:hypothetical protein